MRFFAILTTAFAALAVAAPNNVDNHAPAPADHVLVTNVVNLANEPHKIEHSIKLVKDYVHKVKEHEPHTLDFDVFYNKHEAKFVIFAVYKDQKAFDYHKETHYLKEVIQKMKHEHLGTGTDPHFLELIVGFQRTEHY
ncbi:MAG: hypothetical protein Q9183_004661 [Haloplaca sp. 2 TL-2023]